MRNGIFFDGKNVSLQIRKNSTMTKNTQLQIRNSTAEFLIFTQKANAENIEVRFQDGTIWLSQKIMGTLFDTSSDNIGLHLKNIYSIGELSEISTTEDYSVVRQEGSREVCRIVRHYNLDRCHYCCWLSCKFGSCNGLQWKIGQNI